MELKGLEPRVIYEDSDILAIAKPAGLLVHGEGATLASWLLKRYPSLYGVGDAPDRPGIVHRLDRDTSGVMLVAKRQAAFDYLKRLFQTRAVRKRYLALVWGKMKKREGVIEDAIGIRSGTVRRTVHVKGVKDRKPATTHYRILATIQERTSTFSLLEVFPETGRTHQIRVHLASLGHPVVGDKLYGRREDPFGVGRQFLHAESIEFTSIKGERIRVAADLPDDLAKVIHSNGKMDVL